MRCLLLKESPCSLSTAFRPLDSNSCTEFACQCHSFGLSLDPALPLTAHSEPAYSPLPDIPYLGCACVLTWCHQTFLVKSPCSTLSLARYTSQIFVLRRRQVAFLTLCVCVCAYVCVMLHAGDGQSSRPDDVARASPRRL